MSKKYLKEWLDNVYIEQPYVIHFTSVGKIPEWENINGYKPEMVKWLDRICATKNRYLLKPAGGKPPYCVGFVLNEDIMQPINYGSPKEYVDKLKFEVFAYQLEWYTKDKIPISEVKEIYYYPQVTNCTSGEGETVERFAKKHDIQYHNKVVDLLSYCKNRVAIQAYVSMCKFMQEYMGPEPPHLNIGSSRDVIYVRHSKFFTDLSRLLAERYSITTTLHFSKVPKIANDLYRKLTEYSKERIEEHMCKFVTNIRAKILMRRSMPFYHNLLDGYVRIL